MKCNLFFTQFRSFELKELFQRNMDKFSVFTPEVLADSKYSITGPDCQILTIQMQPGDVVESEPGNCCYIFRPNFDHF